MKHHLRYALIALGLLVSPVDAGTIYVDTAGNGGAAANSGTSDTASPQATGTAATVVSTTVTLDTNTNLTGIVTTAGLTQSAINIAGATNANRTIFWITGVTGCTGTGACSITVDVAPTGVTTNNWVVGGRYLWPSAATVNVVEGALGLSGGQDAVTFNTSPASRTGIFLTLRNPGTTSTGNIVIQGKAGTLPVLTMSSGVAAFFNQNTQSGFTISNLSLSNSGTGGAIQNSSSYLVLQNVKIAGGAGTGTLSGVAQIIGGEISGSSTDGITSSSILRVKGAYIHGNSGNGITVSVANPSAFIQNNLIVGNTLKGISLSGTSTSQSHSTIVDHNTIYGNLSDGFSVTNANTVVTLTNNILQDNGQTSGYNVDWIAGNAQLFGVHSNNVFYQSGAGTPTGNLLNLTTNATELTTSPQFVATGSNNFAIANASPAAGAGTPSNLPSIGTSLTASFPDIGAAQRQVTAGGQGIISAAP